MVVVAEAAAMVEVVIAVAVAAAVDMAVAATRQSPVRILVCYRFSPSLTTKILFLVM